MTDEIEEEKIARIVRAVPTVDISRLSGPEVERAASALGTSLAAGSLKVALEYSDKISKMPIDEINRIRDIAKDVAAKCGGYGCG